MSKTIREMRKAFTPSDLIPLAVVAFGASVALIVNELAVTLIGASIAVLGIVAMIMLISQRMSSVVEPKFKAPRRDAQFQVTTIKDNSAKRTVIENFEDEIKTEEGFRVINSRTIQADKTPADDTAVIEEKNETLERTDSNDKTETPITETKLETVDNKPGDGQEESVSNDQDASTSQESPLENKDNEKEAGSGYEIDTSTESDYSDQNESSQDFTQKKLDVPISALMDTDEVAGLEPRREFEYMISRALMGIGSVINAKTAAFLFVNAEKNSLLLESYVTDSPEFIVQDYKMSIGNDIVSQIALNVKPEILTEISPAAELDLIPYYRKQSNTISFIGAPVFYEQRVIGVLCADTDADDAYDSNTVSFLGHFTKLISALIYNYTEKFDLLQASRTLETINSFRDMLATSEFSSQNIADSLTDSCSKIFGFSRIGVCLINDETGMWEIPSYKSSDQKDLSLVSESVDLDSTLIGKSILECRTIIKQNANKDEILVHPKESRIENGFFAAFPIISHSSNYGALFIEDGPQVNLTDYDISAFETLGRQSGLSVEQLHFLKALTSSALIDPETGALNSTAFYQRLEQEFARMLDFERPMSLCFIQIDSYVSFDPEKHADRLEKIVYHSLSLIQKKLKAYDVFGNADGTIFGIGLIGKELQEAQLWAERLRSEIAISALEIDGKRFTVTISAGLAQASSKTSLDNLVDNARKALEISLRKTNSVSVYG